MSRRFRAVFHGFSVALLVAMLSACGGGASAPAAPAAPAAQPPAAPPAAASPAGQVAQVPGAPSAPSPAAAVPAAASPAAPAPAAASTSQVKRGGTIRAGLDSDVINLDPHLSNALVDRQIHYNVYDSLVAIDQSLKIIPWLAESWEVSTDGKAYTFKLRKGVKFHDGTEFNAEAVKWNFERMLTDAKSLRKSEISSVDTVTVVDPSTVRLNLKAPFAPLLANLVDRAGMMVSPAAVQKGGEDFTRNPLGGGTGPFKFVSWKKDDNVTLEANKDYWRKDAAGQPLPYADRLIYRPIVDETVMLTNVKTGDIDATFAVPPKDVAGLRTSTEVVFKDVPALAYGSFQLNNKKAPFDNKAARQAVNYAIDREELLKIINFGTGTVAYGPIPPPVPAFDKDWKPFKYDPEKAKQIMAAGGLPNGFTFTMKVVSGSPVVIQQAQLLKDQMSKAGITMEILQLEFSKILQDQQTGDFDSTLIGWSGRIDPDGNMYNFLRTGSSFNWTGYSNPEVDDLLDKARSATSEADRIRFYRDAEKKAVDDAAIIYLRHGIAQSLTTPKVQNLALYADQIMRYAEVWLR